MKMLNISLEYNKNFSEMITRKYHFNENEGAKIESLYQAVLPLIKAQAFYVYYENADELHDFVAANSSDSLRDFVAANNTYLVFLTLGAAFDTFQEIYITEKCLSESYMLECIGLDLLTEAYEEFIKVTQVETKKWALKMDFIGDKVPLEATPALHSAVFEFVESTSSNEPVITYNELFVLSPIKSVSFLLPMSDVKATSNPCHICKHCKNLDCILRQEDDATKQNVGSRNAGATNSNMNRHSDNTYSYGYQRIFGNKGDL